MGDLKSASLPSGVRLPYVEQGDPAGVPVVLLHAFLDSWRSFERVLPSLPDSIRAIAVSQRGHGDADRPASGYAVEDFTADLAMFLDEVRLDAAVIVASSSAGLTAQRFAAEHPQRTLGLVFIGSPRSLRDKPGVASFLDEMRELSDPIDPAFARGFLDAVTSEAVPQDFKEIALAENLKVPAAVWRATLAGLLDEVPATETATITAPTVIVWGDRDDVIRAATRRRSRPRSRGRSSRSMRAPGTSCTGSSPSGSPPRSPRCQRAARTSRRGP